MWRRASKPFEQLAQGDVCERSDHEVGVVERKRRRHRIRDGHAEEPGGLGGGDAVRLVLERDRLVRLEP